MNQHNMASNWNTESPFWHTKIKFKLILITSSTFNDVPFEYIKTQHSIHSLYQTLSYREVTIRHQTLKAHITAIYCSNKYLKIRSKAFSNKKISDVSTHFRYKELMTKSFIEHHKTTKIESSIDSVLNFQVAQSTTNTLPEIKRGQTSTIVKLLHLRKGKITSFFSLLGWLMISYSYNHK